MKSKIFVYVLILLIGISFPTYSQDEQSEYLLHGVFVRGGKLSFTKALIMDQNDYTELWLKQNKNAISFGVGYDFIENGSNWGFGGSVNYFNTTLDNFSSKGSVSSDMLAYKDLKYTLLLFDCNLYILPIAKIPVAFSLGFTLDGSFHSYTISGDKSLVMNANGSKSFNIFRYGYILGLKVIPLKFISVEVEYRPMAGYSVSHSYELGDYAYSSGGLDYYYIKKDLGEKEGESENMFYVGISIHF